MKPRVCVYGDGHLTSITQACLIEAGFGLCAPQEAQILWVTFDTPIDDQDHGHPESIVEHLALVRPHVSDGALILISSQVPVGFTAAIEREWRETRPSLRFAYAPENLRVASAMEDFWNPARVVIGLGQDTPKESLEALFAPFCRRLLWMSLESAEMAKHALNSFLALQVAYANELWRICAAVGADMKSVEQALRSDPRIGEQAYVRAGKPFAGGHLARDIHYLSDVVARHVDHAEILESIIPSNAVHGVWLDEWIFS